MASLWDYLAEKTSIGFIVAIAIGYVLLPWLFLIAAFRIGNALHRQAELNKSYFVETLAAADVRDENLRAYHQQRLALEERRIPRPAPPAQNPSAAPKKM